MFENQFPMSRLFDHVRRGLSEEWRYVLENHVRAGMDNQPTCFTISLCVSLVAEAVCNMHITLSTLTVKKAPMRNGDTCLRTIGCRECS